MSTIKSSSENLTLNADGSGNDIKFQSNGVEKASLSDGGVFTATSFAGSGANLTGVTDATKLPLAGGTMTGNIAHAGAFTIDTVGDISLDSEGAILIKGSGTEIGRISNSSNDMIIKSAINNADMLFKGNDGGSTITALTLDMSDGGVATFNAGAEFGGNVLWPDNQKILVGTGADLQIYHDGTDSHIAETVTTRRFLIRGDEVTIRNADSSKDSAKFNNGGSVDLYHNNVKKLETTSEGAKVTGHLRLNNSQEMQFGGSATHIEGDSGYMAFDVGSTERMRITSNGSIHCPSTTSSSGAKFGFGTDAPNGKVHIKYDGWNGSDGIEMQDMYGGNYGTIAIDFQRNGSRVGTIQTTLSATQYNTSSDYRLKENVDYTWDATTRLKQLKPARFNFIADDTNTLVDGFIAHEVSSIVPEAISGAKDATETYTNNEGNEQTRIVAQGIDQSKLVPLLVKTIQELEARITALES